MASNAYFKVEGGARLEGELTPQGAKNEALQVLAAALLTSEPVTLTNLPDILDARRMIELLAYLGAEVERPDPHTCLISAADVDPDRLRLPECRAKIRGLRGSVMLLGPMLARFGKAYLVKPGGDKIGRRRLDTHLWGLEQLGADLRFDRAQQFYELTAPNGLRGAEMLLDEASVTGTANILMAAVLSPGETVIYNAACEPYVQQLCRLLLQMGAEIEGVGSNRLVVRGVAELKGAEHRLLADMIEVGSFLALAAMTQSQLTLKNVNYDELGLIPRAFERMGVTFSRSGEDDIFVDGRPLCEIETYLDGGVLTVSDHTWPGLTPDLLSVLLVLATQCRGSVLIHQKMFESRLFFVDKLIDMGAQIILCDPHRATVIGLERAVQLRAIPMTSPDIRAGVALLIAALSAEGVSEIYNIEQIDRGYERIDERLNALGARIARVEG